MTRYYPESDDDLILKAHGVLDAAELEDLNDEMEARGLFCFCGHTVLSHDGEDGCLACYDDDYRDADEWNHEPELVK